MHMFLQKENKRSFNFPSENSLLQERGYELACSQPHTYSKWVQASHSVCDQLWVSGWNELLCKTDWEMDTRSCVRLPGGIYASAAQHCLCTSYCANEKFSKLWCTKSWASLRNRHILVSYRGYKAMNKRWWRGVESLYRSKFGFKLS